MGIIENNMETTRVIVGTKGIYYAGIIFGLYSFIPHSPAVRICYELTLRPSTLYAMK